jgi:hypothetical protein
MRSSRVALVVCLLLLAASRLQLPAQDSQQTVPDPVPPPPRPKPVPKDAPDYAPVAPESDLPWGLPADLAQALRAKAELYSEYSRRFVCEETARLADYDGQGVTSEDVRHYDYLLVSGPMGESVREYRQRIEKGRVKQGEVVDSEAFPPAYAWVFMFGRFHEPYFSFRKRGTYFDDFDLVHEVEFRGSLPFTDGKDIRQWEGTVLLDAFKLTPIEIQAEPANQKQRVEEIYRRWAQAFNILGFRAKAPPLGYRARIQFRYEREGLAFPTQLRYDTFRAVSPTQVVAVKASTRYYENYRFTYVREEERHDTRPETP